MYALLFFLPTYYRVVRNHSAVKTALLLLPQTLTVIPCAGIVLALVKSFRLSYRWLALLGWLCTACGVGLLALLGADTSIRDDVLLNLPSGIGIGILLAVLVGAAGDAADDVVNDAGGLQPLVTLMVMRYLGSTLGLVIISVVFRSVLGANLDAAGLYGGASRPPSDVNSAMYAIRMMAASHERTLHVQAVEDALRTIWFALSIGSFLLLLLSCGAIVAALRRTAAPVEQAPVESVNAVQQREPRRWAVLPIDQLERKKSTE